MSSLIETIATRQRAHSADNAAIRPFRVSVPEAELTDSGALKHKNALRIIVLSARRSCRRVRRRSVRWRGAIGSSRRWKTSVRVAERLRCDRLGVRAG